MPTAKTAAAVAAQLGIIRCNDFCSLFILLQYFYFLYITTQVLFVNKYVFNQVQHLNQILLKFCFAQSGHLGKIWVLH